MSLCACASASASASADVGAVDSFYTIVYMFEHM